MGTKRYEGQVIAVGQWVNLATTLKGGFGGKAAVVVDVKAKTLIVSAARRGASGELVMEQPQHRRFSSIRFVSETFEEAELLRAASIAFVDSELTVESAQRAAARQRKADAIAAALRGALQGCGEPGDQGAVGQKTERCHAGKDGDCIDKRCPQLRDGEPHKSGRHCPLDVDVEMA